MMSSWFLRQASATNLSTYLRYTWIVYTVTVAGLTELCGAHVLFHGGGEAPRAHPGVFFQSLYDNLFTSKLSVHEAPKV